ncbi:PIN/TRAM domain-containing protein [Elusimicrobiota bacterium]
MILIWVFRLLVIVMGPMIGYFQFMPQWQGVLIGLVVSLIVLGAEISLSQVPLAQIVLGLLGAVLGIIGGRLLDFVVGQLGHPTVMEFWESFSLLIKILLAYLGLVLVIKKFPELDSVDDKLLGSWSSKRGESLYVLDTSALIDGRLADILKTKFLQSGTLIVPRFVLDELQRLSDDSDGSKRNRGRRGLDVVSRIQEDAYLPIKILDNDYPKFKGVDQKLLELAKDLKARVITTDFNLFKVSNIQKVEVLNVNDLAQALKAVVLPGEPLIIYLVKDGKERDQGVGYLDDGTMVVVEGGRSLIGKRAETTVTSILQTSAGKMVFARTKGH